MMGTRNTGDSEKRRWWLGGNGRWAHAPGGLALVLALVLAVVGVTMSPSPASAVPLTVNSTGDAPDAVPGNGVCETMPGNGVCTLRAAIQEANALTSADDIVFNIPTSDLGFVTHVGISDSVPCSAAPAGSPCWWRIGLLSPLPTLTDSGTRILGSTQTTNVGDTNPGAVGSGGTGGLVPTVGVDACPLPTYARPEIAIDGNGVVSVALDIDGAASSILIEGMAVYNTTSVAIQSDGSSTTVGTNRIIGRDLTAVPPVGQAMFVGVLPDGTDPLMVGKRNLQFGVRVTSPSNLTVPGYRLDVVENFIGLNGRGGIDGGESASVVTVTKNEVFGNGWNSDAHDGIDVNGVNSLAECNLSRDNTNSLVTQPKGDAGNGIEVGSKCADGTTGCPATLDNNVIRNNTVHGNLSAGISVRKGPTGNIVQKNVIFDNEIGISIDWEGRTPTDRDLISQNSTFMNMGLGIDLQAPRPSNTGVFGPMGLFETTAWVGFESGPVGAPSAPLLGGVGPDGVTPNDTCDPDTTSNQLQNWPTLTAVITDGSATSISGTLNSTASTTFVLQFFATPDGVTFLSGDREGKTFLGSKTVTTSSATSTPACTVSFTATFAVGLTDDDVVTATATDPLNNTSEYSNSVPVAPSGQKVTGGGTFQSPPGAYTPDSNAEGRASFGFNIKLKDLNPVPQGVTNFRFRPADLHFISTAYTAGSFTVVDDPVSGKNAEWKGTGKLNNTPGRCFQVNVHDDGQGAAPQGTENDKFRIKISMPGSDGTCATTGVVVFDNDPTATLAGQAGTLLDGGNIEVHKTQN